MQRIKLLLLILLGAAACSPAAAPTPTLPPTIPPRAAPTALPTPVDMGDISDGEAMIVTLPGGTFVLLSYSPIEDQNITITARALSDDGVGNVLDPVISVLNDAGDQIAYNDDHHDGDGLAPSDAQIRALSVVGGEMLTIRVNAFNGFQAGDISVAIDVD